MRESAYSRSPRRSGSPFWHRPRNGRDTSVAIFNLRTLAPLGTVKVTGRNPDAIVFDTFSGRVFTFNGGGANATAIDAAQLSATVAFSGSCRLSQIMPAAR
ncbi:MAG: hypothetical protein ABIU86_07015 [Gemmatimonadaceae bacterium]